MPASRKTCIRCTPKSLCGEPVKRTQWKDTLRNVWKQKVSYLSIIVIALLGVTTFLGIDYSDGALRQNGSRMYNAVNFRDIEIVSTLLLTEDDLAAIRATEGVACAKSVWQTDAKFSSGELQMAAQVISLPEGINLPALVEGRLPGGAGECAVEQRLAADMGWHIGDSIEALDAKGEAAPYLRDGHFVITGIANHPDHTSVSIPDTLYVMVTEDAFDRQALDNCFMKAEVVIEKSADIDRFGETYDAAVAAVSARLESLAEARAAMRDSDIHAQYQSQIDEGLSELNEAKAGLESARAELDDGWQTLADAEQELADGEKQLSDADTQLKSGWQKLLAARAQLQETEAGLAEARAQLDAGAAELSERQAQLAAAKALLQESWEQLEDIKAEVRGEFRSAIETLYGGDTSGIIDWAPRMSMDPDKGGASAMDFWITAGFKCDLNKSMYENATDLIYSGEIPDEVLIQAYEALTGGEP